MNNINIIVKSLFDSIYTIIKFIIHKSKIFKNKKSNKYKISDLKILINKINNIKRFKKKDKSKN